MIETVTHEAPLGKSHHQSLLFGLKCLQGGGRLLDSVQSLNISD